MISFLRNIFRPLYLGIRNRIMARGGLQPEGTFLYSRTGLFIQESGQLNPPLPNISGGFHPIVWQLISTHGLGDRCLLVSESNAVKPTLREAFPSVIFSTSDLYPELLNNGKQQASVDFIWDVCNKPDPELINSPFNSIICNAMLEHVIAPTTAIFNMMSLLKTNGYLYLMTHTPSYHYHECPRDYVRFHHDYFQDIPDFLRRHLNIYCELEEIHSHHGVICACYRRT